VEAVDVGTISDAAIEVLKVGRDGIRFRFGAELRLPGEKYEPPRPPSDALPVKRFWVTAASPPPTRDGLPWESGLLLNDPTAQGAPTAFQPTGRSQGGTEKWQLYGVNWDEGILPLDEPPPGTIVLNQALLVPFEWEREMVVNRNPDPLGFLSIAYEQPDEKAESTSVGVNYYGEYTLPWSKRLNPGDWVAISFDRFTPPERKSADFITQVQPCNLFSPPTATDDSRLEAAPDRIRRLEQENRKLRDALARARGEQRYDRGRG
jgi:hypothetical protein